MRVDNLLVKNKYFSSRTKAQQAIARGEVFVRGKLITKPSEDFSDIEFIDIEIKQPLSFVSLGGYKLEKALRDFNFSVHNTVCADIGASTGGFTDCLLQRGARKVYAVDLNNDLLDLSIKNNKKVIEIIKNARDLSVDDFSEKLDLIVADLSFISAKIVVPILSNLIDDNGHIIILIKPQFENEQKIHCKNGIIKDEKLWKNSIIKIYKTGQEFCLTPLNITCAPLKKEKNREFLILFKKGIYKPCEIPKTLFE